MQRKALKQLGKVTQWTNEKVFSGEKTQLSSEFTQFEKDIDITKNGIERLHAVSEPFFQQVTKRKTTSDPLPPGGSSKDKILHTEALGLVMIDYGDAVVGGFGDSLAKYGRARCRMAGAQEEFGNRLGDGYMANLDTAQSTVEEYKSLRKKLDSRRLALDAATSKLNSNKKGDPRVLEEEVEIARARFDEVEEECVMRGEQIASLEQDQYNGLTDLLEAELEYFTQCKEILDELKQGWPSGPSGGSTVNRPRSKSNVSNKSFARGNTRGYSRQSAPDSDDDNQQHAPQVDNRSRSQSNASAKSKRTSMLPSFGFGSKKGLAMLGTSSSSAGGGSKRKSTSRMALHSDEDDDHDHDHGATLYNPSPSGAGVGAGSRNRSGSTLSQNMSRMSLASSVAMPAETSIPRMRRTNTAPSTILSARYLRAKHDFAGTAADELPLRVGQIIEFKSEVNEDWYLGESEGMSGIFPANYSEEYRSNPVTIAPPLPTSNKRSMPPRADGSGAAPRNIPPPAAAFDRSPSPGYGYDHSESEFDSNGYEDADHYATAALSSAPQANPVSRGATPSSAVPPPFAGSGPGSGRKKAPPPPPSRRSQSSSNILSASFGGTPTGHGGGSGNSSPGGFLSPPQPAYRQRSNTATQVQHQQVSAEASPFGGSEDEGEAEYLDMDSTPSRHHGGAGAGAGAGNGNGLGAAHLGRNQLAETDMDDCGVCGCDDFTQNSFKPRGTCSTCFHQHT